MPQTPKSFVPTEQSSAPPSFVSAVETPRSFVPIGSDKPPLNDPGDEGWDVKGTPKATGSTTLAGIEAGLQGMKENFGGWMQMIGKMTGIEALRKYGDEVRKAGDKDVAKLLPRVTKLEDIRSSADAVDWLTFTIGSTAPSSAASIAGGVVGGTLGSMVPVVGTTAGAIAGAGAISWLLNAGDLYSDLIKEGHDSPTAAAAAGIPMALLDVIMPVKQAGKLIFKPAKEAVAQELKKRTVGAALKGVAKEAFVQEALPELGQELIAMGTEAGVTEKIPAGALSRALNSLAGGFVGGAAASGAVNLISSRRSKKDELVRAPEVEPEVEPVVVQTNTAPLAGEPAPATPADILEQQVQQQVAEALPPADIIPEILEPSPDPGTLTAETLVDNAVDKELELTPEEEIETEEYRRRAWLKAKEYTEGTNVTSQEFRQAFENKYPWVKVEEPVPVTPQTLTEPSVPSPILSVPTQPLDEVVTRLREKWPNDPKPPSIVTTFLEKTNQWYASVKRESPMGDRVVESVYAPTENEARTMLAERLTEKIDLLEAQDNNMEALLQASLSGPPVEAVLSSETPIVQPTIDPAAREVSVPLPTPAASILDSLPSKPLIEDVKAGKPIQHEVGFGQFEEMMVNGIVPNQTKGGGIHFEMDPDSALATPSLEGTVPVQSIKGIVVNSSALPSPVGLAKSRLIEVSQRLGVPVRFLGSKKQVTAFLNQQKLDKDLKRIAKRQSEAGFVRLDMADLWTLTRGLMDRLQKAVPNLPKDQTVRTQEDMAKFGKFSENWLHLIQIAERNPGILPLQKYLGKVREFWTTKTRVTKMADQTLQVWNKLGDEQFKNLSDFLKNLSDVSFKEKRRLGDPELVQFAVKHRLSVSAFDVYKKIDSNLLAMFRQLEENMIDDLNKRQEDPLAKAVAEGEIRQQFEDLRNRNFFPISHFGTNIVLVRAKKAVEYQGRKYRKGQLVEMSSFETEKGRDRRMAEALREYPSGTFDVKKDLLSDKAAALRGFPSHVFKSLWKEAKMSLEEIKDANLLEEEWKDPPSESNLVKSLKRERKAKGFSADTQRTFANFFAEGSNYVARMEHRWDLEGALQEINDLADAKPKGDVSRTRHLYYSMRDHYEDLMNPGNDWAHLRGWLFPYFFALVPKQAFVNITQIPMLAYPHLAATYKAPIGVSDAIVLKELTKAASQVGRMFDWESKEFHITSQDQGLLQATKDATEAGLLNESFATEVAGIAHGNLVRKVLPNSAWDHRIRQWIDFSTKPFSVSEQFNRHTTFIAAYNLGKKMGLDQDGAFKYARGAVEHTMFEYARWNKPKVLRSKAGVLLALQTFKMNALYFYGTQPGRGRALGVMLAMGGLMGLPFAEDLLDLLNLAGTWWKEFVGSKNPRVDLAKDAREMVAQWHLDPDTFMNGIMRSNFPLHQLGQAVGVPIPAVDISPSIQMGRVLPGLKPIVGILQGVGDPTANMFQVLTEWSGVAGTTGMNAARAIMDDSVEGMAVLKYTGPAFIRNMQKSWEYASKGAAVNSRGEKLVEFDLSNIDHQAEILGQLMGFTPTRLSQMQARRWAQAKASAYYNSRRELMFNEYARARASDDKGEKDKARLALREYNQRMPPQFRITIEELIRSVTMRNKNERIREKGLPTQKRYIQLYKSFEKAYPVSP